MKRMLLIGFLFVFLLSGVFAGETNVDFFYATGCSHCHNVFESGVLDDVGVLDGVVLERLNVYESQENRDLIEYYCGAFDIEECGWPFVVVECDGKYDYLMGDVSIIEGVEDMILACDGVVLDGVGSREIGLTWGGVIIAALIDSINPCAFGVLIFLMASLLKMGSSRRALRAGMIYSFVVFLVYFLIGLSLYKIIDSFASSPWFYWFYVVVGVLIGLLGLVQLKDVFWYGKGFTLKISDKVKPLMEGWIAKGTLVSIVVLGVVVSLFELPCTGEIYLGILTMMSLHKVFGIGYLIVYNFIFVLPLIVLTYLVYRGTSTKRLQDWTVANRKYMKLASGLLLLGLAGYILVKAVGVV